MNAIHLPTTVSVGGLTLNHLKFADDMAIIAGPPELLQLLICASSEEYCRVFGLDEINPLKIRRANS